MTTEKDELNNKINQKGDEYLKIKESYKLFSESIKTLLEQLLDSSEIKYQIVTCRGKDLDSLKGKLKREKHLIPKKLNEIIDLAGCRVIFYLEEDLKKFINIIRDEFEIKEIRNKDDPEGYNAIHFIIELDERRKNLAEHSKYSDLKCEIQLTTVLFHAWSEIGHDIIYKDKEQLENFSSNDLKFIEKKLQEIMREHIYKANYKFSFVVNQYNLLVQGKSILNIDALERLNESESNDEIIGHLNTLNNFTGLYPLPKEFIFTNILETIWTKAKNNNSNSFKDVLNSSFTFLSRLKYWDYENILKLIVENMEKDNTFKEYVFELLKEYSKYDLNAVKVIGYKPQKKLVQYLNRIVLFNKEKTIKICTNLLTNTIEGNSSEQYNTYTLTMGAIPLNDTLKEIRKSVIEFLFGLLVGEIDQERRNQIIDSAFNSTSPIHHGTPSQDNINLLKDNAKTILEYLDSNISHLNNFDKREIEMEMSRLSIKNNMSDENCFKSLSRKITEDEEYKKFKIFIGYDSDFLLNVKNYRENRQNILDSFIEGINEVNYQESVDYLKNLMVFYNSKTQGLFHNFNYFLYNLAIKKPDVAKKFDITELLPFKPAILDGLLRQKSKEAIESDINKWIEENTNLKEISSAYYSIPKINKELFEKLASQVIASKDLDTILILLCTVARQYSLKKQEYLKKIFLDLISCLTELKYYDWGHRVAFTSDELIKDLTVEENQIILNNLKNTSRFGYDEETFLLTLVDKDVKEVIKFFHKRVTMRESGRDLIDSIPHSFQRLKEPLSTKASEIIPEILNWYKKDDWKFNWEASHLLNIIFKQIDGDFKTELIKLIEAKDKESLDKVLLILDKYEGTPDTLEIVVHIIKNHTITNKLRNSLFSKLSHTGVVMGEYGFVDAYKKKIEQTKPMLSDDNEKVVEFTKAYINSLENSIKLETARVEKEHHQMEEEFNRTKRK